MKIKPYTTMRELCRCGYLSQRTLNCLARLELATVADLLAYLASGGNLQSLAGFGRKCSAEVSRLIAEASPAPEGAVQLDATLTAPLFAAEAIDQEQQRAFMHCWERSKCPCHQKPEELLELLERGADALLAIIPGRDKEAHIARRLWHADFIHCFLQEYGRQGTADPRLISRYTTLEHILRDNASRFTILEEVTHFLRPEAHEYLQEVYDDLIATRLSSRARNFLKSHAPDYRDMVELFDQPQGAYTSLCPGQSMRKTLGEVYALNNEFRRCFQNLDALRDLSEITLRSVMKQYPAFDHEQHRFINEHLRERGHHPLFFILRLLLLTSSHRWDYVFTLYHGLRDGRPQTLAEISEGLGISAERVRQIVHGQLPSVAALRRLEADFASYSALTSLPFVTRHSPEWHEIARRESLMISFRDFCQLASQLFGKEVVEAGGCTLLMSAEMARAVDVRAITRSLAAVHRRSHGADTPYPIDSFGPAASEGWEEQQRALTAYLATDAFDMGLTPEGDVVMHQNSVDVTSELIDILRRRGRPMHLDEIFADFKKRYPGHKYTTPSRLRSYIYQTGRIRAIGKQSTYGLAEWEGCYYGNIRDIAYEVLEQADGPMHISVLAEAVRRVFPDTGEESLSNNLKLDTSCRYAAFEGGYFGLSGRSYGSAFKPARRLRANFDERLQQLTTFIEANGHYPFSQGDTHERMLQHWLYNALHRTIGATPEQLEALEAKMRQWDDAGYHRTAVQARRAARAKAQG